MTDAYYCPIAITSSVDNFIQSLRYRYENTTSSMFKLPIFKEEEEAEDYAKRYGVKNANMIQITKTTTKRTIIHIKQDEVKGFYPIIFFGDDFIEKCCEVFE